MKLLPILLICSLLFFIHPLPAQEAGDAAAASAEMGSSNNWQSWVFASSALISAAIGVIIVSVNPGSTSH
jgi:hypothetical protein